MRYLLQVSLLLLTSLSASASDRLEQLQGCYEKPAPIGVFTVSVGEYAGDYSACIRTHSCGMSPDCSGADFYETCVPIEEIKGRVAIWRKEPLCTIEVAMGKKSLKVHTNNCQRYFSGTNPDGVYTKQSNEMCKP